MDRWRRDEETLPDKRGAGNGRGLALLASKSFDQYVDSQSLLGPFLIGGNEFGSLFPEIGDRYRING